MQQHRGQSKRPQTKLPESYLATAPNQVWTWDITWLKGPVQGLYYRLYLILDLFSRKIVGWDIWETEEAKHAEELIKKAVLNEKIQGAPLVLPSDNGSPMKASTFQGLLEKLGIQSSYSRPRVSNDNPYSESIFRTLKYRPAFPYKGFKSIEDAQSCIRTRKIEASRTMGKIHKKLGSGRISGLKSNESKIGKRQLKKGCSKSTKH